MWFFEVRKFADNVWAVGYPAWNGNLIVESEFSQETHARERACLINSLPVADRRAWAQGVGRQWFFDQLLGIDRKDYFHDKLKNVFRPHT